LWDEARVFKGLTFFSEGTKAPIITGKNIKRYKISNDELLIFSNYD